MSNLVKNARIYALEAHKDQVRKYTGVPYITHCAEVVELLESVGATEEEKAAGWLHDTVEDCGKKIEEICDRFGSKVSETVDWLTDISKPEDGTREVRKEIDLRHTARSTNSAKKVKLADTISNSRSILQHDPNFARVYLVEKWKLMRVIDRKVCPQLWDIAWELLLDGLAKLNVDVKSTW